MSDWYEPFRIVNKLVMRNGKLPIIAYLSVVTFMAAVVYSLCFPPSRTLSYEVSPDVQGSFVYPSVANPGKKYKVIANFLNGSSKKEHDLSVLFRSADHYISLKTEKSERANWINILSSDDTKTSYWPIFRHTLLPGEALSKEIDFLLYDPGMTRDIGAAKSILSKLKRYHRRVNISVEINIDGNSFHKVESLITIWRSSVTNLTRSVLVFLTFTLSITETARRLYFDVSR